jgi:hypothetical protein
MTPTRFYFNCDNRTPPGPRLPTDLIGVDPGDHFAPDDYVIPFLRSFKTTQPLHFYCVGLGEMSWSAQERRQIEYLANIAKVDMTKDTWHDDWVSTGWHRYVWAFFNLYHKNYNAYSIEIDNLDGAFDGNDDALLDYFAKLEANLRDAKVPTKLMLKNVSGNVLKRLKPTGFFAPWAIFEEGTGNENYQLVRCAELGIQAITPSTGLLDTNHYGVIDEGIAALPVKAAAQTT